MSDNNKTFYLYCEVCDYKQDVKQILPRTPFTSIDELRKEVHRFHCSVCGAKHVVVKEGDLLIEVKSSAEMTEVRMAVGQLYDYHRQLPNREKTSKAILLPKEPDEHVKELLKYAKVGLLYFKKDALQEEWW